MNNNILAAIDVGSSKICTLVTEITSQSELRILGVGVTPAQGIKKGIINNIQEAREAIVNSVEKAERSSGSRIVSAYVSISGNHTASVNNRGIATIPGKQRPITHEDIDRAMEGAQSLSLPANREVLHSIARFFILDGQDPVSDPIGMFGQRLDMDTHIVTGSLTAIQNLTQCVEGAGVQIEELVFSPLASAEAVLTEEEKLQGVVLADIGGGTTDLAVFMDGSVFHSAVLPVGGYQFTHDLVAGLRVPFSRVEEAKIQYGCALPSKIDPDDLVQVEGFGDQQLKEASVRRMAEILQARAEEVLEMIFLDVKRAGFNEIVAAGMVLTGGGAALRELADLAEMVLQIPVRIGAPRGVYGLADSLSNPAYATSVGLLHWAARSQGGNGHRNGREIHLPGIELKGALEAARRWLKTLIPQ